VKPGAASESGSLRQLPRLVVTTIRSDQRGKKAWALSMQLTFAVSQYTKHDSGVPFCSARSRSQEKHGTLPAGQRSEGEAQRFRHSSSGSFSSGGIRRAAPHVLRQLRNEPLQKSSASESRISKLQLQAFTSSVAAHVCLHFVQAETSCRSWVFVSIRQFLEQSSKRLLQGSPDVVGRIIAATSQTRWQSALPATASSRTAARNGLAWSTFMPDALVGANYHGSIRRCQSR
jgi:hypothetical protein